MSGSAKAASALSRQVEGLAAIEEACATTLQKLAEKKAGFAVLFASQQYQRDLPAMLERACKMLGTEALVGCSACGVLTEDGEHGEAPALGLLAVSSSSDLKITPFIERELKGKSREIAERLLEQAPAKAHQLILFPDIFSLDAYPFFSTIQEQNQKRENPLAIMGAAPSSENPSKGTYQIVGKEILSGGLTGFFMESPAPVHVGVSQACHPVSPCFEVTACEGQWISELDGKPAIHVLRETIPEALLQDPARLMSVLSIAVIVDERRSVEPGNYMIRNIAGLDMTTQVIACAGKVREGAKVCFALRSGDSAREHLKTMLSRLKSELDGEPPQFGLYFNCCARGEALYGLPDIDVSYIRQALHDFPLLGLSIFAEIGPLGSGYDLQAYTGVLMLA